MSKKYVLSCVNGYPPSQSVIEYGCWLAKTMDENLKLFHAIDNQYHENRADLSGSIGIGAREDMLEEMVNIEHQQNKLLQKKSKLILESAKLHAEKCGATNLNLCLRKGRVLDNILDFKDDLSIVVIGKYGKNHQGMSSQKTPVGHKVEGLVKKVHLPLLIISEDYTEPQSITLLYDGSNGAKKVIEFLTTSLGGSNLSVEIIFFGENNSKNQQMLSEAKAKLERSDFVATVQILSEDIDDALPNVLGKKNSDLLAMGAFGHGVLHDIFVGSFTSKMIQISKKPILLVK